MHWILGLLGLWCVGAGCGGRLAAPAVRPGIDVLLSDSLRLVRGRRVGLVTNQSGVDARGVGDVERLRAAGVNLVALFSPEHGFRGTSDPGASVASTVDSATGLPIYSLYGRTSAPSDTMLAGVDVMLIDLQDAGARYYTYLWTTVQVMRATSARGIPVVLLDRPNPIGGTVQGNVLDSTAASPVGLLAVPMRHGMTLGELARLAKVDLGLGTDLTVVPALGWTGRMYFDQTGLPFVAPSPNLRGLESLEHYPGLCLFEGTNLSVGRGTERPFEQIGAPWLDTARVLAELKAAAPAGVAFSAVAFRPHRPGDQKYDDSTVAGIRLTVTDRASYDPPATAVLILSLIHRLQPTGFQWLPAQFDRLAGGPRLREQLSADSSVAGILASWAAERTAFLARRQPVLLYPR